MAIIAPAEGKLLFILFLLLLLQDNLMELLHLLKLQIKLIAIWVEFENAVSQIALLYFLCYYSRNVKLNKFCKNENR